MIFVPLGILEKDVVEGFFGFVVGDYLASPLVFFEKVVVEGF